MKSMNNCTSPRIAHRAFILFLTRSSAAAPGHNQRRICVKLFMAMLRARTDSSENVSLERQPNASTCITRREHCALHSPLLLSRNLSRNRTRHSFASNRALRSCIARREHCALHSSLLLSRNLGRVTERVTRLRAASRECCS